jgi:hypothetical protein
MLLPDAPAYYKGWGTSETGQHRVDHLNGTEGLKELRPKNIEGELNGLTNMLQSYTGSKFGPAGLVAVVVHELKILEPTLRVCSLRDTIIDTLIGIDVSSCDQ